MKRSENNPSPTANKDEVWTPSDVAAYLRCTARHVTNLAARGELPGRRFGTLWRFKRSEIEALLTADNPGERQ